MPRVHHVKKALKDNRVCKKGEEYFWWVNKTGLRSSVKRMSKTRPKPSQLTTSEFLSEYYSVQEDMQEAQPQSVEDLQSLRDEWAERIREIGEGCRERFENMPEGLQQGDTGQLLEQRADGMESWANDLEGIDLDFDEDEVGEGEKKETALDEFLAEKLDDISGCDPGVD